MISNNERRLYEKTLVPLALYDYEDGKVITELVSDGLCSLIGEERDTLIDLFNNSMFDKVHPDDSGRLASIGDGFARRQNAYDVIYRSKWNKDDYHVIHTVGFWQTMEDGSENALLIYNDMTESLDKIGDLSAEYEQFKRDEFYADPVTGLPNQNYMKAFADETIDRIRIHKKAPMLIYMDIKSMKTYNNQYGYSKGDELIILFGKLLEKSFKGFTVSRGTIDHYVIIGEAISDDILKELLSELNREFKKQAYGNTYGFRAGICMLDENMTFVDALDRARQQVKNIGDDLNVIYRFYSKEAEEAYWKERYIIDTFEEAMKNGWIKAFYQPILRTDTGKLTVLEALARWADPVKGMIMPGEFIPVLSRFHLLHKLDLYIVEQICKEYYKRKEAGLPLIPVSVNFSAQDFDYINVLDEINSILKKYDISRDKLIIEVTEQDIAKATDHFRKQLGMIHKNGYKLWIDDFGSGYSAINVFSQFNIDRIKLDMNLLRNLDDNGGVNRHIVSALVDLSKKLKVNTLAEGVETPEQLDFLLQIGCDMAQGFYFYKPEDVDSSISRFNKIGPIILHEGSEERKKRNNVYISSDTEVEK